YPARGPRDIFVLAPSHAIALPLSAAVAPSPLVPYTTLFRSPEEAKEFVTAAVTSGLRARGKVTHSEDGQWLLGEEGQVVATTCPDRKSTRLNSSHVSISYAVFCLKKTTTSTSRRRTSNPKPC